jgi:2'-hydroxyisoflavone reductase
MVELGERGVGDIFNSTNAGVSWSELLESCRRGTGAHVEITWLPDDFLVAHGVTARELPMWFPEPATAGANDAVVDRALAAGLRFRPVDDTVRGALEDAPTAETAGLTPEREAALLEAWHARG